MDTKYEVGDCFDYDRLHKIIIVNKILFSGIFYFSLDPNHTL